MTGAPQPRVIIVVPTFRRPAALRVLIAALMRLERPCGMAIVVADNDAGSREGLVVVREIAGDAPHVPLRGVLVAERGLASVRNALIAEALSDPAATHVAMIDDDEWPEPQWIAQLLAMQQETGASIVGGPVFPVFEEGAPSAVRASRLFRPGREPDGRIDIVWGTNNVMITRECLEAAGPPWFDARYALSGGEDVDFFIRQQAAGRRFAWSSRAIVHEAVPPSRARIGWLLKRAFRIGNTNGRIQNDLRFRGRGTAAVMAVALGKLLIATVRWPLRVVRRSSRADAFCDIAEASGMLLGVIGYRYEEYAV